MRSANGLNVTVWGEGEPAVFVHGSFGWGEATWPEQRPLSDAYRLLLVDRRGFGGSPADGRVDFDRDADDVAVLLEDGAHLVGHSYGGVVSLLAASRRPDAVRTLTVIEPPALALARGHPAVEELIRRIDAAGEETADPSEYRARFLRAFGFPAETAPLEGLSLEAARASMGERPPWEAEIPLDVLAGAGLRVLVVRGDWCPAPDTARERAGAAFHAVCDVLRQRLATENAIFPAAHSPQQLGNLFNDRVRTFWETA
ncbi:MAG TPA: alpha/beta fold hydrolase [Gaiellaceae bacterium]